MPSRIVHSRAGMALKAVGEHGETICTVSPLAASIAPKRRFTIEPDRPKTHGRPMKVALSRTRQGKPPGQEPEAAAKIR